MKKVVMQRGTGSRRLDEAAGTPGPGSPRWAAYAAGAWSLAYGLLGLYWSRGGAGFPFGPVSDPDAALSILTDG